MSESSLRDLARLCRMPMEVGGSCALLPPDWSLETLCAAASEHEVVGLFAASLLAGHGGPLTDDWHEGMGLYLEGARLEAAAVEAQLVRVLGLFAKADIAVMPFKGPLLAQSIHADRGFRSCRDLDVMIRTDEVAAALDCLTDAGYVHQSGLDATGIAALRRYAGEYILFRNGALPVEPHWQPAPTTMAFDIDMRRVWDRAKPGTFLGAPCHVIAPADHLMLLAMHGAKERWHKLKWLFDVHAMVTMHPQIDLVALREDATSWGGRRILDLALLLSKRLFGTAIDAPHDHATMKLAVAVTARLAHSPEEPPGPYRLNAFHWQLRERRLDRLRYALRTMATPRVAHYRRLPLPPALHWLYVPLKFPWDYALTPMVGAMRNLCGRVSSARRQPLVQRSTVASNRRLPGSAKASQAVK
ncbi:MAG: nucleotidyltransferase family protein [Burkholderiaceae bacterium]